MQDDISSRNAIPEQVDDELLAVLGHVPKRWGRMDQLSRLAVIGVGRTLRAAGLLSPESGRLPAADSIGLIGATRWGSLTTDLDFAASMAGGVATASPMLFSYTLANIALAEAASHYGITGPVHALYVQGEPLVHAEREARRWLVGPAACRAMLAGEFDVPPRHETSFSPIATFSLVS